MIPPPPGSTPFPYTTLFRSSGRAFQVVSSYRSSRIGAPGVAVMRQNPPVPWDFGARSEEHTSELQSLTNLVCRLLLEKKKKKLRNTKSNTIKQLPRHGVCGV